MKILSIQIENFRGFEKFELSDFKDINLIVGKNNSGKTSILEALFLSIGVSNPNLVLSIDSFRGLIHDESEDFRFVFRNLNYEHNIIIKTTFKEELRQRILQISPVFKETVNIKLKDLQDSNHNSNIPTNAESINGIEFKFEIDDLTNSPKTYKSSIKMGSDGVVFEKAKNYKEELFGVFQRPTTSALELYTRLDKILIKKGQEKFINALKLIDPKIKAISLGAKNMIYFDIDIDRLIPIQIMGDGIIHLLSLMSAIANTENGFVVIDEIENGFHYSVLDKLWETIYETSKFYNTQLFITTHSYECVKAFRNMFASQLIKEDNLRIYRIEKKNDQFKSIKYDHDQLSSSLDNNWEIR